MRRIQTQRRAFTLIEIMVVVVVLSILAAVIIPNVAKRPDEAKVSTAHSNISEICTLLENFRLDMGRYPDEDEGLAVLRQAPDGEDSGKWKGPYATKDIPKDPWGNPYHYYNPCPNGIDGFGVESYGADGQPGGTEFNTDIQSWSSGQEETQQAEAPGA